MIQRLRSLGVTHLESCLRLSRKRKRSDYACDSEPPTVIAAIMPATQSRQM